MAFPSKESKLIAGSAFKAWLHKRFVLRNKIRAVTRKEIDTLVVRLASVLGLPGLAV